MIGLFIAPLSGGAFIWVCFPASFHRGLPVAWGFMASYQVLRTIAFIHSGEESVYSWWPVINLAEGLPPIPHFPHK